jgi:hypothetical protein
VPKTQQNGQYENKTGKLTLASLKARVLLVDHVQAAFAAHHAAVFIAFFRGLKRAENFHKKPITKQKRPLSSERPRPCQLEIA